MLFTVVYGVMEILCCGRGLFEQSARLGSD
jgi:hypothetical protein